MLYTAVACVMVLAGCNKNEGGNDLPDESDGTRWITLTAALAAGTDGAPPTSPNGNGGTLAYAITHEQAIDPTFELDIFGAQRGFHMVSPRTSRVQGSEDGAILWDIQYTGDDAGLFQTYSVRGKASYIPIANQVNTQIILGNNPRWIKSTDDIGVGVNSDGETLATEYEGEGLNATFIRNIRTVAVAILDLKNPGMLNTRQIPVAFPDELARQGYTLGRTDVPLVNRAQTKVYIGCNVSKIDPTKPSLNDAGEVVWTTDDSDNRTIGTVTLMLDYPSLRNPTLLISGVSTNNNHGYRTKTQYVGSDGHIYQAAVNHGRGHQILRISRTTDAYDDSYVFDLNQALGIHDAGIAAWRYIQDGKGIVLYKRNETGGYLALIDLHAKTAQPLSITEQTDENMATALDQYQNIGIAGDFAYVPLTPSGKDGHLYVVNWKTGEIIRGATLKGFSLAHYVASY